MRANIWIFAILSIFFGIASVVYALWTMADPFAGQITGPGGFENATGAPEWVGTVGLSLSSILALFLSFYLWLTHRAAGGELPEDRQEASIDDGDPELGQFSPWSWWPLVLASGLGLIFLGLAVGVWIAIIGAPITLVAIVGWNYEYYRGNFAR